MRDLLRRSALRLQLAALAILCALWHVMWPDVMRRDVWEAWDAAVDEEWTRIRDELWRLSDGA